MAPLVAVTPGTVVVCEPEVVSVAEASNVAVTPVVVALAWTDAPFQLS